MSNTTMLQFIVQLTTVTFGMTRFLTIEADYRTRMLRSMSWLWKTLVPIINRGRRWRTVCRF